MNVSRTLHNLSRDREGFGRERPENGVADARIVERFTTFHTVPVKGFGSRKSGLIKKNNKHTLSHYEPFTSSLARRVRTRERGS